MMRGWQSRVGAVLLGLALLGQLAPLPAAGGPKKLKVAAAFPGIITDKGFNQNGFEGLKLIEKEMGAEIAYTERVAQPDQVEVMSDYARRGFDLVFGHGGEFDAAGKQVASQFPKTKFVMTNGTVAGPNLASIQVHHFQVSFLAGVVGGMMSKTNKIAVIIAQKFKATEDLAAGIEQGAKFANPKIQASVSYTGNWDDVAKAKEASLAHIAKGADVLFPILDHAVLGVMEAAKEKNTFAVGMFGDQLDLAPKHVLTSGIENIGPGWLNMAKLVAAEKFQGKQYVIGLENAKAAGLGRFNPVVPQRVKDKVEEARKLLIAGKITQK
ncbi:MAG: BMP family protein [Armatimonadota bacterium]